MKISIDGRELDAKPGQTILEVARAYGIYIPSLCWHPRTGKAGRCRACLVEIDGVKGLKESCIHEVTEGMVVHTQTEKVLEARKMVVNLLLANGKHDFDKIDANGINELRVMAESIGITKPLFTVEDEELPLDESSEGIVFNPNVCIHCGRCVLSCNNNVMHEVLDFSWRGSHAKVACDDDKPMGQSTCVQCGECVQVCPVSALTFKSTRGKIKTSELEIKRVICPYCGVGCVIDMYIKDNKWQWSFGTEDNWENLPNKGMLCVKGRFGMDFINHPDRLTKPLIKRNGKFKEVSWDEALDYAASGLKKIRDEHGSGKLAFFSSAKATNEENYVVSRFARGLVGTNNVDHCSRLCHSSSVAAVVATLGSGAMTNSMQEALVSDVIFVIGSNVTWNHPVFGGVVRNAVKRHGKKLIVADPREIDVSKCADIYLQQKNGSDVALLMGMQHIIIRENWHNTEYINGWTEGWDEYRKSLDFYTPEKVEKITGVPKEQIYEAAKLYSTGGRAAIYWGMGISQHSHGTDNAKAIVNLALITGNIGFEGGGVNPLRGQNNVQGAGDMGLLPDVFTGYQSVTDPDIRKKFSEKWGIAFDKMDPNKGLTSIEIVERMGDEIRGLYILGENPLISDPNLNHAEKQFRKLDFLVVQDIFLTETAQLADVVLPGVSFAEKTGTYTNTERRVQLNKQALIPPDGARQDYEIIADLATRMGAKNFPRTPESIFQEIRELTPSYAGITYPRLEGEGLRWPCPTEDHPGTKIIHVGGIVRGKGLLTPLTFRPSEEEPDNEYPFRMSTGRLLQHWHTGSMTRRTKVLSGLAPKAIAEIHPSDAVRLKIADGDKVRITTRRGTIISNAQVTDRVHEGSIFIPFHFAEAAANRLTNDALDPVSKIPEYKVCAAKLEKV